MTAIVTDLLGDPQMERNARFVGNCRLELVRRWNPRQPMACVIGHNPSLAGGGTDDPTVRWWIEWFRANHFGGFTAVNFYPWVAPDPAHVYRKLEEIEAGDKAIDRELRSLNLPVLVRVAKTAHRVFVCHGAIARDARWIDHVVHLLHHGANPHPDLWCWGTNADGSPRHPMARGKHRIPRDQPVVLWRAAP